MYVAWVSAKVIKCFYLNFIFIFKITFFFLDVTTKEYLLVMQYANGGDLQNYLKNRNLSWNDKKKLAHQIADGLNYLHNENVLHKDLVCV